MTTTKFTDMNDIVYATIIVADNYNAGVTMESVDMGKYNHGTLVMVGDVAAAGAGILTMMAGAADAAVTAAITFTYRIAAADVATATADTLGAPATSAALTLVEASIRSGMYVIEWDVEDMNVAGVQYNWMTPVLSAAGTAGIITAIMILSEPRYAQEVMPTAI
jgi:hypothetical protein